MFFGTEIFFVLVKCLWYISKNWSIVFYDKAHDTTTAPRSAAIVHAKMTHNKKFRDSLLFGLDELIGHEPITDM